MSICFKSSTHVVHSTAKPARSSLHSFAGLIAKSCGSIPSCSGRMAGEVHFLYGADQGVLDGKSRVE